MKKVQFRSDIDTVAVKTEARLLDALLARQVKVKMLCGGRGLCATCHVYVTKNAQCLTPQTEREKLTLAVLTGAQANSRLACQSKVIGEGVEVAFPEGLYIESFAELESLVGQRTTLPIRHPVTGEILIQAHKLIVRSLIMQLKNVEFDIDKVKLAR